MSTAGKRVLVVEDDALVAMLVEEFISDIGYHVEGSASRLPEARALARTLDVNVALLDVNLHGELSYPVAEILRERGIPFVLATGYGADGLPESLHGATVLSKPFKRQQLAEAISRAMGAT